mmetsp:Transcript_11997/g.24770  ORF Transcript_11997/g.24770 Transcript_11997/m.24770 type:complete len:101 (-) Transcript_11997:584-886(-)
MNMRTFAKFKFILFGDSSNKNCCCLWWLRCYVVSGTDASTNDLKKQDDDIARGLTKPAPLLPSKSLPSDENGFIFINSDIFENPTSDASRIVTLALPVPW